MLSCAAIAADRYSASVLDNATVGYFLLHYDIALDPRLKKYPKDTRDCIKVIVAWIEGDLEVIVAGIVI